MAFPPNMNRGLPPGAGPGPSPMAAPAAPPPAPMPQPQDQAGEQDQGGDEGENSLSQQDVQALQDGVSPQALDVLKRVLPDDCQFIVDLIDQGGDEGSELAPGGPQPGPSGQGGGAPGGPSTRLGSL